MAEKTSSILDTIANPVVANPLAAMDAGTRVAGNIYNLRTQQANEAIGGLLQQATDANGNIDYAKANALASQAGPVVQMGMQEMLKNNSALRSQQLAQSGVQNQALNSAISSALALPDDQLHDAVVQQTQRLVAAGILPQDRAYAGLLSLSSDPKTLRTQLETLRIQGLPPGEQGTAIYGNLGTVTGPGGKLEGYTQRPQTGAVSQPAQTGANQGMTPAELNTTVMWTDNRKTLPDGSPNPTYNQQFPITKGDLLKLLHPETTPGGVPGQSQIPGNGRIPPALTNPNKPQQPAPSTQPAPAPAPQGPQPAPGTIQPAPGEAEIAKASPARFQTEIDTGGAQPPIQATLSTMQSDINRFSTGSGAQKVLDWKRAAQSWAPGLARLAGVTPDSISSQESFQKAAAMIVAQQQAHSDKSMDVIMAATPHDTLSPDGVDSIIRQLQGNSDYLQARAKLAQAFPNRTDYGGFQAKVADLDPRYFQYMRLTPQQKTDYFDGLRKAGRSDEFKAAFAKTQALIGGS